MNTNPIDIKRNLCIMTLYYALICYTEFQTLSMFAIPGPIQPK